MHALLGLAASHLTITSESGHSSLALSHRFLAIKGLNKALSKTPRTGHDGDALLASCFALTFQSSYMADGLLEFLTFLRGCKVVTAQLAKENVKISFDVALSDHSCASLPQVDGDPAINTDIIQGATSSLESMLNIIQEGDINLEFYNLLKDCVRTGRYSSQAGSCDHNLLNSRLLTKYRIHEAPSGIWTVGRNGSAQVSGIYSSR
jgi:hypothetical protein